MTENENIENNDNEGKTVFENNTQPVQPSPQPIQNTKPENPLLKKIKLPGQRYRMPSRGLFYNDGELDDSVVEGEVEVFSMTSIDEITLRSPEFLFSGEAIEKVFNRCIPEIKKPLKLLTQDIDYLLTCLRIISYGGILPIDARCPKCEEKQEKENNQKLEEFYAEVETKAQEQDIPYEIALQDEQVTERIKKIQAKKAREQTYHIDLSGILSNNTTELSDEEYKKYYIILSNGQELLLAPLRLDSAVMAYRFQNEDLSEDLTKVEDYITFVLASRISHIDGIEDQEMIVEWVKNLPISLKDELNRKTERLSEWGTKFDYNVTCEDCGHERNMNTLLNPITFFMKPSELEEINS